MKKKHIKIKINKQNEKKNDPDPLEDSVAVSHDGMAFDLCSRQRLPDTLSF